MDEKTKEKRIQAELKRLQAKFELVDGNQREVAAQLLQNAAFMAVTLQDLQEIINTQGVTDEYKNGANQYGTKASATLQSYNSLIKNYQNVIKTLAALVPYEKKTATTWPTTPRTNEEAETDHEAKAAALKKELEQANAYQEYQRECRSNGVRELSFSSWKAEQNAGTN